MTTGGGYWANWPFRLCVSAITVGIVGAIAHLIGAALLIVGGITTNQPFYWGFGCVVMIWSPLAYRVWKSKISPPS